MPYCVKFVIAIAIFRFGQRLVPRLNRDVHNGTSVSTGFWDSANDIDEARTLYFGPLMLGEDGWGFPSLTFRFQGPGQRQFYRK